MTGRDLIIYILENHLEDASVVWAYVDKNFDCMESVTEIAERYGVGLETVHVWLNESGITGAYYRGNIYVPSGLIKPPVNKEK